MPAPQPDSAARRSSAGIDPRGPRFGAGITAVLLLIDVFLGLSALTTAALVLLAVVTLLFAWGAFAGVRRHPYGWVFARFVRPRLAPPTELEDALPPTFAQGVGFVIALLGVVLQLLIPTGPVPVILVMAAALAFVAAFLNSAFGYCLGCQIYLLLVRTGIVHPARTAEG
jgi:hypothetical protein